MARQELLVQLIVDGRAIWQIRQPVDRSICRRMSAEELKTMGMAAADLLNGIVGVEKLAAAQTEGPKKKR